MKEGKGGSKRTLLPKPFITTIMLECHVETVNRQQTAEAWCRIGLPVHSHVPSPSSRALAARWLDPDRVDFYSFRVLSPFLLRRTLTLSLGSVSEPPNAAKTLFLSAGTVSVFVPNGRDGRFFLGVVCPKVGKEVVCENLEGVLKHVRLSSGQFCLDLRKE